MSDLKNNYSGVFDGKSGFGQSPALVIVDFVKAYVTKEFPLYAEDVVSAVKETVDLLKISREKKIPVIFTQVLYYNEEGKDGGIFVQKVPILKKFRPGEPMTDIVPELSPVPSDIIIIKQYASAFFGTNLAATLTSLGVDTVILTGCSTSGCIRASSVDALQHGFRLVVPKECVGDRHKQVHEANLFDINAKYGDVLPKADVLKYLESIQISASASSSKKRKVDENTSALVSSVPKPIKVKRDALGWRKKMAVLIPSTNTIVEPDFYYMVGTQIPGVTFHFSLIHISSGNLSDDNHALDLLQQIRKSMEYTCTLAITAEPDWIVCGMSAETFVGGKEGNAEFTRKISEYCQGRGVSTGADACAGAFEKFGVKKIGIVTPYQPVFDKEVKLYFESMGYEVLSIVGLKCPSAVAIAHVQESELREALMKANVEGVECLVQCGTNLSMVKVADEAEKWLGKPVIAINAAILWHALRVNGINDKLYGCGRLLREF